MQVAMRRDVIRRKPLEAKPRPTSPTSRDGGVQSVDRALSIIETLAEDDEGYRLSDLAVRTGLSTSTVHRLLATLEKPPLRAVRPRRVEMACRRAQLYRRRHLCPPPQFLRAGRCLICASCAT